MSIGLYDTVVMSYNYIYIPELFQLRITLTQSLYLIDVFGPGNAVILPTRPNSGYNKQLDQWCLCPVEVLVLENEVASFVMQLDEFIM